MSQTVKPPSVGLHPPQLRMWHLLAMLFAASILCAPLAPLLRQWTALQWSRCGLWMAAALAGFIACAGLWLGLQRAARQRLASAFERAGPIAFRVKLLGFHAYGRWLLPWRASCFLVLFVALVLLVALNRETSVGAGFWMQFGLLGFCAGTNAWMALASLAKPADVHIGERGMIIEGEFKPWSAIELYRDRDWFLFRWFWFTCVIATGDESQAEYLSAHCQRRAPHDPTRARGEVRSL